MVVVACGGALLRRFLVVIMTMTPFSLQRARVAISLHPLRWDILTPSAEQGEALKCELQRFFLMSSWKNHNCGCSSVEAAKICLATSKEE